MSNSVGARRASIIRTVVVAFVIGALLALGFSAPAFAVSSLTETLHLVNKSGAALPGFDVYPIDISTYGNVDAVDPDAAAPVTGKAGYYTMPVTPGDSYTLFFFPGGAALNSSMAQYLGGSATLNGALTFTPSATNSSLTASVATGGTFTGKVTGPTGAAQKNADVSAYRFNGSTWLDVSDTLTSSSGSYTFVNAVPGSYKFEYYSTNGVYPPIYSGGAATIDAASSYYLGVGAKLTVNQKFVAGTGAISGQAFIDFTDTGEDFGDDHVLPVAIPTAPTAIGYDLDKSVAGTRGDRDGNWKIKNLQPGTYIVELLPYYYQEPRGFLNYAQSISTDVLDAKVFTVVAGQTTATGFVTVEGTRSYDGADPRFTIMGSNHLPLAGAQVRVESTTASGNYATGTTAADGSVQLFDANGDLVTLDGSSIGQDNPLEPGQYTLSVIDPSVQNDPYQADRDLGFGTFFSSIQLDPLGTLPGFTVAPSIPSASSDVGTGYQVLADATRDGEVLSYQWLRDGKPISGATTAGYASTGADLGAQLSVIVTGTSFGFDPVHATAVVGGSSPAVETEGATIQNEDAPTITPTLGVFYGSVLQAHVGDWSLNGLPVQGLGYTYNWINGSNVVGHGSTYTVQAADVNAVISLQVIAGKSGYLSSAAVTASNTVTPGAHAAPVNTKAPKVSTKVSGGVTTFTATSGSWNTSGLTFTYVWHIGPQEFDGQSVTSTQLGLQTPETRPLSVVVYAGKAGDDVGASTAVDAIKAAASLTQTYQPSIYDSTQSTNVDDTSLLFLGDQLLVPSAGIWESPYGLGATGYTYQWFRNGIKIAGATSTKYTVSAADVAGTGNPLTVVETAISPYYLVTPADPDPAGHAQLRTFSGAPTGTMSGTTQDPPNFPYSEDGSTDTWTLGSWGGLTGVTTTYQWFDCPSGSSCNDPNDAIQYLPIAGQTKSSLLAKLAYNYVVLQVSGTKTGYQKGSYFLSPGFVRDSSNLANQSAPTIGGTTAGNATVGVKLTGGVGKWSTSTGVTYAYSWQEEDCTGGTCDPDHWIDNIVSTSPTYTPGGFDYAYDGYERIRLVVTATKGSATAVAVSTDYQIVQGTLKVVTAPKVTVTSTRYSVTAGATVPSAGSAGTAYQWYVGNTADQFGGSAHTPGPTDAGKPVYVIVTYSVPGYVSLPVQVLAKRGAFAFTNEAIDGTAQVDHQLSVDNSEPFFTSGPAPVTTGFQWLSNGAVIKGQTGFNFTPTGAYLGKHIALRVTSSDSDDTTATYTTPPVTIAAGTFTSADDPAYAETGTPEPGAILTAIPDGTGYGTSGITFSYQWQRSPDNASWVNIAGSTSSHFTAVATDANTYVRAFVTPHKTGYTTGASQPTVGIHIDYSPTLDAFTPPSLAGGHVGAAVTVSAGVWNTPSLTFSYAWYLNGKVIPGLTSASWTPSADSLGEEILVDVTASRTGWAPVVLTTQALTITDGAAPVVIKAPVITKLSNPAGTYSVSPGTWSIDGLTYSYQWTVGGIPGVAVSGSTSTASTFTPDGSQHGVVSVEVTVVRAGYADASPRTISSTFTL